MIPRMTVVSAGQSPRRLDLFLAALAARVSRASIRRWIDGGLITLNGQATKAARLIRPGDVIVSHLPVRDRPPVEPEALPLAILHEDDALIVVDKPAGLVMHPAPGNWRGTLLNALVHHVGPPARAAAGLDARARPGLLHRLDKGTSGVLVIAKTDSAHRDLSEQFRAHSIHRVYLALAAGSVRRGARVDLPLGRDTRDPRRVSARSAAPRRAVTDFRVVERLGQGATLLEVRPQTGRMHQIRAHLAAIGHPVLGDPIYGAEATRDRLGRPMLHAAALGFAHPSTGDYAEFTAPVPSDMEAAMEHLRERAET